MTEKIPHMETIKGAAKLTGLSEYFITQTSHTHPPSNPRNQGTKEPKRINQYKKS